MYVYVDNPVPKKNNKKEHCELIEKTKLDKLDQESE